MYECSWALLVAFHLYVFYFCVPRRNAACVFTARGAMYHVGTTRLASDERPIKFRFSAGQYPAIPPVLPGQGCLSIDGRVTYKFRYDTPSGSHVEFRALDDQGYVFYVKGMLPRVCAGETVEIRWAPNDIAIRYGGIQ